MSHKKVISFTCKKEKNRVSFQGLFNRFYKTKRSRYFKSTFQISVKRLTVFLILRFKSIILNVLVLQMLNTLK